MVELADELIPTRHTLLSRLKDWGDHESWRDFFDTYWKLIYTVAVKAGLNDADAQDVVQETVLTVAKKIHHFKYDPGVGSFKGWLLQTTRWRIIDQFRRRTVPQPDSGQAVTPTVEDISHAASSEVFLDQIWEDEWQRNLTDAAIEKVKGRTNPRQYQLFHLYVVREWSVEDIVSLLGVTAGQVYTAKSRVSELIRKELNRLKKHPISSL